METNIEGGLPKKGALGQFANLRGSYADKRIQVKIPVSLMSIQLAKITVSLTLYWCRLAAFEHMNIFKNNQDVARIVHNEITNRQVNLQTTTLTSTHTSTHTK